MLPQPPSSTAVSQYRAADQLHRIGFNVFPLPFAKKGGFPWKFLTYIRLQDMHLRYLFTYACNFGVMMGRTSSNLFVLDCETEAVLNQQIEHLRMAGIPIWMSRTNGKQGGGHLYLRCADGEVENIHPGVYQDLEVRGNGCYVLCPPSVHPDTGAFYEWGIRETAVPPTVKLEQLSWLKLRLTKNSAPIPSSLSDLSAMNRDFVLHGAAEGERNNRLFRAACDLVGNGYSYNSVIHLLTPPASNSGLMMGEIRKTIASAYSKPRSPAKPDLQKQDVPLWARAKYWAENREWTGRTAESDRAAFLACCDRGKKSEGGEWFRAAGREIADMARLSHDTASKALRRLVEAGFLIKSSIHDRVSDANLYAFGPAVLPVLQDWYTSYFPPEMESSVLNSQMPSDAAELGALGKAAYRIYGVMCEVDEPMRAVEWAELVQVSTSKMYRALARLRAWGLVIAEAEHRYRAVLLSDSQLDVKVAAVAGTLGKGEKRRIRHEEQRHRYGFVRLIRVVAKANNTVWRGPEDWGQVLTPNASG